MRVVFRVDASVSIGTGHLARCLTLARMLASRGHEVAMVSRDLPGSGLDRLELGLHVSPLEVSWPDGDVERVLSADFQIADAEATCRALGNEVDWVVVDSYGLSATWERRAREFSVGVAIIDDLANRTHDCDLLLDQNRSPEDAEAYAGLVPGGCEVLTGPRWALLRPEFATAKPRARVRDSGISRILVFLGGADASDRTSVVLRALEPIVAGGGVGVDVVLGPANPHRAEVERLAARIEGVRVSIDVADMAERVLAADLAIGAAGTATWERVHLGLPAVLLVVAENQREVASVAEAAGAGWVLPDDASEADMRELVSDLLAHPERVAEASRRAFDLAGGDELAAERLAEKLEQAWVVGRPRARLRRLEPADRERLLRWRNGDRVRMQMADRKVIDDAEHLAWFGLQLPADPPSHLVFEVDGSPAGVASLSGFGDAPGSCEWGFYLGEKDLPELSGSRMCFLLLEYAFDIRDCGQVRARVRRDNDRSLALHRRFGFEPDPTGDTAELAAFALSAETWRRVRDGIARDIFVTGDCRGRQAGERQ